MAIYSAVPPPAEPASADTTPAQSQPQSTVVTNSSIDIEAWTISALQSLSVSPIARGTGSPLTIPIDVETKVKQEKTVSITVAEGVLSPPRRPPSRRDSQKKRDELLKGKEGSRQRRRWENGIP